MSSVCHWLKWKGLPLYARMVRERKPPEFIARGWALGIFVGCAVPFGFQLVVSVPLSFFLKCSKVGAVVGTFITNPLTIFFIYPVQAWLADRLFFGGNLSFTRLVETEWTFEAVMALGADTLKAFLMGGLLNALVLAPLTYFGVRKLVQLNRIRQAARKPRRRRT